MTSTSNLQKLDSNAQKGSKPRCHWLTHGTRKQIAMRLTELIEPYGKVSANDHWMPEGFCDTQEARLDKACKLLPKQEERDKLRDWWLAVPGNANTPNWDIASTCTVDGNKGLLLVEAKAHAPELNKEVKGKDLSVPATTDSQRNHMRIGVAIQDANSALKKGTRRPWWKLSRDRCYQMSNRFAWSCKLAELGYPVILVYLGFLNAEEMGTDIFDGHDNWASLVKEHSQPLFHERTWDKEWNVHGQPFVPLIRSCEIPHDAPIE